MNEAESWPQLLAAQLPLLGHRNWIGITDWAYPWQAAGGVETVFTGANQIEVVRTVLESIDHAPHLRPIIYTDSELRLLPNSDAKGVETYRKDLDALLEGRDARILPHEEIIAKLDAAGRVFRVLLLKSTLTLPYTSVFVELDCGYWSPGAEERLRQALAAPEIKT